MKVLCNDVKVTTSEIDDTLQDIIYSNLLVCVCLRAYMFLDILCNKNKVYEVLSTTTSKTYRLRLRFVLLESKNYHKFTTSEFVSPQCDAHELNRMKHE